TRACAYAGGGAGRLQRGRMLDPLPPPRYAGERSFSAVMLRESLNVLVVEQARHS
ncbi:hypothetical protein PF006_g31577, partial [Phytophthora fragariae]